ncbi:MAG: hypothetical protein NVS2B7_11960 [Herpetosiphon sp.]
MLGSIINSVTVTMSRPRHVIINAFLLPVLRKEGLTLNDYVRWIAPAGFYHMLAVFTVIMVGWLHSTVAEHVWIEEWQFNFALKARLQMQHFMC